MKKYFIFTLILAITSPAQSYINQHFLLFNNGNSQLQTDEVIKVVQDNNGTYWFAEGADNGKDALYSFQNGQWVRYDSLNSPLANVNIFDMIVTPDNRIVLATNKGLFIKNGETWSVINSANSNLPANLITRIAIDRTGMFWLGVLNNGVAVGSGNPFTIITQSNGFPGIEDINFFAVDDSNNVYAGVDFYGLYRYNGATWATIIAGGPTAVDMTDVTGGMLDKRNTLWVAINKSGSKGLIASVDDGGVVYYDSTVTGRSFRSMYWSVVTDNSDNPYIGTDKGLLYRFNNQWNWFDTSSVPGLPANGFWRGSIDSKNNIIFSLRDMSTLYGYRGVVYHNRDSVVVTSLIEAQTPGENGYNIFQNYPNPFNPSTRIRFTLSSEAFVTLKVYDIRGIQIATLQDGRLPEGEYEREFTIADQKPLVNISSGVYFYNLLVRNENLVPLFIKTEKMMFLK